jgi:hypothetical protein
MMSGMAGSPDGPDPIADVSWSARATELYIQGDVETAMREIGPEHMTLFHAAIKAGNGNPAVPRPGHPQWEHYLSYLQVEMEKELGGPLDSAPAEDGGTTVTMTEVYDEGSGSGRPCWPPARSR